MSELCWNKGGNNAEECEWSVCRGSGGGAALVSASAQFCPLGLEFEAFVDGAAPGANWQILFYFLLCSLNNFQNFGFGLN